MKGKLYIFGIGGKTVDKVNKAVNVSMQVVTAAGKIVKVTI